MFSNIYDRKQLLENANEELNENELNEAIMEYLDLDDRLLLILTNEKIFHLFLANANNNNEFNKNEKLLLKAQRIYKRLEERNLYKLIRSRNLHQSQIKSEEESQLIKERKIQNLKENLLSHANKKLDELKKNRWISLNSEDIIIIVSIFLDNYDKNFFHYLYY